MINHDHKFIFVHIPKCGGSSILYNFGSKFFRSSESHYQVYNNILIKKYFIYTFVRNPWDRLVSEFMWVRRQTWWKEPDICFNEFCKEFSGNVLWKRYLKKERVHLWSQTRVLQRSVNHLHNINYIGRFETYQSDFDKICDKIGLPQQQLPHINKSKRKHYTEYYDVETKQIVANVYTQDIELFGYKFGE